MKKLQIVFAICILYTVLHAQQIITLQEATQYALAHSFAMNSAKLNLASSQNNLEAIERGLMTSLTFEVDAPRYARSLQSQFNTATSTEEFYQIGNTTVESRLYLTQPVIFTNGTFSLTGSVFGRDQFSGSSSTKRDYYSNISFRFRQPLFGFNALKASKQRAELNLSKAERNYTKAEADLLYSVTATFYRVYRAKKELEIAKEKVRQTEVSFETASNKLKAGLIAEVEALQLEVDLASSRNQLLSADVSFKESKNNFLLASGYPINLDFDVESQISYIPVEIHPDSATAYALENRTELINNKADIVFNELSVSETDAKGRITGLLTANYGINKNDKELKDVFHAFLEDRSVSFTLQVPVWDWGKNAKETEAAQANLKLAQLNADNQVLILKKEIETVYNDYKAAQARVAVLSKSVELAQKSYDISMERFKAGNITSFDLTQMQIRLTEAKQNSLGALIDYLLSVADMERKTLHKFTN
ncbi:MAG: TolC family protein [Ignavibacteriales bacterium]|nr:TolC family protein [Ignavibacteriales bacterium]